MTSGWRPLVSVVIPCFNQAHFLVEAIESVRDQIYSNVELVVVDDGSADNSFEVAGRYPDIRRLRQSNRGVAAARNLGFAESRGTLVVFLDADDRLLPERYRRRNRGTGQASSRSLRGRDVQGHWGRRSNHP